MPLVGNLGGYAGEQEGAQLQAECAHAQERSRRHLQERVGHEVRRHLAGAP